MADRHSFCLPERTRVEYLSNTLNLAGIEGAHGLTMTCKDCAFEFSTASNLSRRNADRVGHRGRPSSSYFHNPPSVKALRQLKLETGIPLFNHANGRLYPSAEAEALDIRAQEIIGRFDCLDYFVTELRDLACGGACISQPSRPWRRPSFPDIISKFHRDHAKVQVEISALPSQQVVELVREGKVDLAFFHTLREVTKVDSEEICGSRTRLFNQKG